MPDYPLGKGRVIVKVDEGLPDTDAPYPAVEGRTDNLESIFGGIATDVNGLTPGVGGVAATALGLVVGDGTVRAVQHQRNAGLFAHLVEQGEEARVHLADVAGRSAFPELRGGEILTHNPLLYSNPR